MTVTGYSAYANTAGTAPVTGTGGSPTVTIARSTSSPLMETASGLFTKDAANRQGQGFSIDFTIDSGVAAQGLPCTIQAYYKIASGTYASGDMTVWIYDVTNGQVIQPSGSSILNATIPQNIQCEFQPNTTSTSYRLCFHVTTTSASAYTLQFDNVAVSPNTYNPGAVATALVAYTPTITGFGTASAVSVSSQRIADRLFVTGTFTSGTPTAVPGTISLGFGGVNGGITTDNSGKLSSTPISIGDAAVTGQAGNNLTVLATQNQTTVNISVTNGSLSGGTAQNANNIAAAGNVVSFTFCVPIQGWGVNQVLSSDTATNVVSANLQLSTNTAVTANVIIKFDTVLFDTMGSYSTSTGFYAVPVPGYYSITGTALATSAAGGIYVQVSGSKKGYIAPSNTANVGGGGTIVKCVAGDTLGFYSDTSNTLVATNGGSPITVISIQRISGPAQVAASESINARYFASATSISGSLATISWTTKDYDSHNAMSAGTYTCPSPGKYQVNAALALSGTFALNNTSVIEIQKNGTVVSRVKNYAAAAVTQTPLEIGDEISCIAGDTLRIQVSSGATGPAIVSSNFENYISLFRTGN